MSPPSRRHRPRHRLDVHPLVVRDASGARIGVTGHSAAAEMSRRAFDVVAAGSAAIVLAPVAAVVAVAVRLRLGAPVLFAQERPGVLGRPFTIVKFRTMTPETHEGQPDAERILPLGRALRAASLDELPQLWNILRGEMSVIGPRPASPEQVDVYSQRQLGRLAVRPGLTGWAQVHGRNALSWPERIELDLWYVEHRRWTLDLAILLRTVAVLLRARGVVGEDGENPEFPGTPEHAAQEAARSERAARACSLPEPRSAVSAQAVNS